MDQPLFPFLPAWPPETNQLLWFALLVLFATVLGEVAVRFARVPRLLGWLVAGLIVGPYPIGLLSIESLRGMRPIMDVTLALLLFQLGHHLDLTWLRRNPWLFAASLLEAGFTAAAVFGVLRLTGMDAVAAAAAGAIAMATSPAIVMQLTRELRAEGQVTERMLLLTALNSAYAVIAVTVWLSWLHLDFEGTPLTMVLHPLYVIVVSAILAALGALGAHYAPRWLRQNDLTQLMLVLGTILLLTALAELTEASVFLVALALGTMTKHRVEWLRVMPKDLSVATSLAVVVLFALIGASMDLGALVSALPAALALVAARMAAKVVSVVATARRSGMGRRKGSLLGLGLAPMSGLAIVLVQDTSGVYPAFPSDLQTVVLAAVFLCSFGGPLLTKLALIRARETRRE